MAEPIVHDCFEPKTSTWQYVVADPATKTAVIIDSVLDFDPATNTISTNTADKLLELVKEHGYTITKLLETHVHADHITAAKYLQTRLSALQPDQPRPAICIGKRIYEVSDHFAAKFGIPVEECAGAFDCLLADDEQFAIGQLTATALHLPGHTPDHLGYMIGSNIFCGDSLFNPDVGTARCDFPGGSAQALYASAQKLLSHPGHIRIWTGHDYPPGDEAGRGHPKPYTTVEEQSASNKHLKTGVQEHEFVAWRSERDSSLAAPKLINQSLQMNIRAGAMPKPTEAGDRLLHVPLKVTGELW